MPCFPVACSLPPRRLAWLPLNPSAPVVFLPQPSRVTLVTSTALPAVGATFTRRKENSRRAVKPRTPSWWPPVRSACAPCARAVATSSGVRCVSTRATTRGALKVCLQVPVCARVWRRRVGADVVGAWWIPGVLLTEWMLSLSPPLHLVRVYCCLLYRLAMCCLVSCVCSPGPFPL